jgi:hypothetical protein
MDDSFRRIETGLRAELFQILRGEWGVAPRRLRSVGVAMLPRIEGSALAV